MTKTNKTKSTSPVCYNCSEPVKYVLPEWEHMTPAEGHSDPVYCFADGFYTALPVYVMVPDLASKEK